MKRNYAILRLFVFIFPYGDIFEEIEAFESLQSFKITTLEFHDWKIQNSIGRRLWWSVVSR